MSGKIMYINLYKNNMNKNKNFKTKDTDQFTIIFKFYITLMQVSTFFSLCYIESIKILSHYLIFINKHV